MVCPACISAVVISQLPAVSAAALSVAGIKLAYDQKHSPNAQAMKGPQPVRALKVYTHLLQAYSYCLCSLSLLHSASIEVRVKRRGTLPCHEHSELLCRRPEAKS